MARTGREDTILTSRLGGKAGRRTRFRAAVAVLGVALAATTAAACGSSGGDGNGGGGNGGNENGGGQVTPAPTTVSYMLAESTQVELLSLDISNPDQVTGALEYEYNCGNGQSATGSALSVTGTQVSATTVDLQFSGISTQFTGVSNSAGMQLSGPGGSEQLTLIGGDSTPRNALSQIPAVSSVSGYSCSDLPPNPGP